MGEQSERLRGTVVSVQPSLGKYGGSFGEIQTDDGQCYVFSAAQVYRNRSHAALGVSVTFSSNGGYAMSIDSVNEAVQGGV